MSWLGAENSTDAIWLGVGFAGQLAFTSRFLVQWLASERKKDSVVPTAFWWFSLAGGLTLLSYAIHKRDPVIVVGQAFGVLIYLRNLILISEARRARRQPSASPSEPPPQTAAEAMLPPDVRPHPPSTPTASGPNDRRTGPAQASSTGFEASEVPLLIEESVTHSGKIWPE